jgi:hypothetical protein
MKKTFNKTVFTILIFITNLFVINAQDLASNVIRPFTEVEINKSITNNQTVYICTGQYAYAYHSRNNCPGLSNCGGQILTTDEASAFNSRWNKPCCRCWSNVISNCKDDNPTYGKNTYGGSGDEASFVAIAIIAGSAIILSNDIYVYRVNSFYKDNSMNYNNFTHEGSGTGWAFGFRKTFNKSSLEYGMSIIQRKIKYGNNFSNFSEIYGIHLNYIHNIFDSKMPKKLSAYIGPSINTIDDIGYGAIIGANYKIFNRLKVDLRYEYTTQTNQVQLGLIFNYQKKYFWQ